MSPPLGGFRSKGARPDRARDESIGSDPGRSPRVNVLLLNLELDKELEIAGGTAIFGD